MKPFFDTNILVYAQQAGAKGDKARALMLEGGTVSVQVLNECANVLRKKLHRSWDEIDLALDDIEAALGPSRPLTGATHKAARQLAKTHGVSFYDALILATAIEAGCTVVYSEGMQDGRVIEGVTIRNPFD